jgi:hypothetical protein
MASYLAKAGQNERVKDIANRTSPFVAPREAGVGAFSLTNTMLNLELSPSASLQTAQACMDAPKCQAGHSRQGQQRCDTTPNHCLRTAINVCQIEPPVRYLTIHCRKTDSSHNIEKWQRKKAKWPKAQTPVVQAYNVVARKKDGCERQLDDT